MTTLTINQVCETHIPNKLAKSFHNDTCYTFCESCEQNIDRFWIEDPDRLSWWSDWSITK